MLLWAVLFILVKSGWCYCGLCCYLLWISQAGVMVDCVAVHWGISQASVIMGCVAIYCG